MPSNRPAVAAVVLAGGGPSAEFQAATGVSYRVLAEVGGKPLVEIVLDALRESQWVSRILLVADEELAVAGHVDERLPPAENLVANMNRGLRACGEFPFALLVTADLPFLTTAAVDALVEAGVASGGGFCYPAIRKEENERRFPGMHRTYVRLADGVFTGGNLFLVRPDVLLAQEARVAWAYTMRKKPLRLAFMFGVSFFWRLFRGTLSFAALEERATEMLGVPARALVLPYPELGADIDRPEDLEVARRLAADAGV